MSKFPIVELFGPVIQGEGALAGHISYFLRTGGCGYRCSWCDSMHAVDPKQIRERRTWMTADEVVRALVERDGGETSPRWHHPWVTLTGGDPVVWDLREVVDGLCVRGFRVAVETQGDLWRDWLEQCDLVTISPKGPSSGMADRFRVEKLQKYWARLGDKLVLKVVVFDEEDLEFAARCRKVAPRARFFLSSGTLTEEDLSCNHVRIAICDSYRVLSERILADERFRDAVVLPQLHVLAWGTELGR